MIVMRMLSVCCVTSDSAMSGSDNQWSVMRKLGPCKSETLALARRIYAKYSGSTLFIVIGNTININLDVFVFYVLESR